MEKMSAEEELKKITNAARNLEIQKNEKRNQAIAQAFYEKGKKKELVALKGRSV